MIMSVICMGMKSYCQWLYSSLRFETEVWGSSEILGNGLFFKPFLGKHPRRTPQTPIALQIG